MDEEMRGSQQRSTQTSLLGRDLCSAEKQIWLRKITPLLRVVCLSFFSYIGRPCHQGLAERVDERSTVPQDLKTVLTEVTSF